MRQPKNSIKNGALNIYAVIISWKRNKENVVPIAIRFDYQRQRVAHEQLGHRIYIKDWNEKSKIVKRSHPNHALLNQLIENKLNKHRNFLRRETFNLPITRELIKKYVCSGTFFENFFEYADQLIATKKLKDEKPYSKDTKRRYRDEVKRMLLYTSTLSFR